MKSKSRQYSETNIKQNKRQNSKHISNGAEFTKEMRRTHTIYMPDMVHYHNDLLCAAFKYGGYNLAIVPECKELTKYTFSTINKDYCTCAPYIVGNLLTMLVNLGCNTNNIAFLEPQAGGACRAGNYYNLIIECLRRTGNQHIPVLSLNTHGLEQHSGFSINAKMLIGAVAAVCYSDLLMTLTQQIKPYEIQKGQAESLRQKWISYLSKEIVNGHKLTRRSRLYQQIIDEFKKIPTNQMIEKTKVGIVGELYIKFSPIGNSHLEEFLAKENCDYRQGGFLNYCIYVVFTEMKSMELLGKSKAILTAYQKVIDYMCRIQKEINQALDENHLLHDSNFDEMKEYAKNILSEYNNIGDGWLITAEVVDLIKQGYKKVLIVHPFGCLVSHVSGRGVIKKLNELYPEAKVSSVEFDYDQSNTLRESRILLAIS